uniref:Uncharacterized protein n=1 Tax=viral metagenome TaxID=1070528 RepID=A0A6C0BD75_9ZZZZ
MSENSSNTSKTDVLYLPSTNSYSLQSKVFEPYDNNIFDF